jgi:2-iminoacetate synthase
VKNRSYVQYLCALRIILPDAGIILSTREGESFRDQMAGICITQMSAGSRTEPGGYSGLEATVQFETEDRRSVHEFCSSLRAKGLEPVFTDWSPVMK